MKLKIGRRHTVEVATLEEASRMYQRLRDESGEGGSTFPDGRVGKYRISYNGRVWEGPYVEGQKPVMEAAATPRQYAATAKFHERMAEAFRRVGRIADAQAAERAAAECRAQVRS